MALPLSDASLDQLFREARSFSRYTDQPVTRAQMVAIWDLMKMGPTSTNQLPARLVWCHSSEAKSRLALHAAAGNKAKIEQAPVCVIVAMDTNFHEHLPWLFPHGNAAATFSANEELRKTSAMRNSSLQGAYLILAARSLGLDCGPMSGFDNNGVDREFLADNPQWKSNFICSLGYGDRNSLHPRGPRPDFDKFNTYL